MDGDVGYAKHTVEGRDGGNSRNGTPTKTVITDVGPVDIDEPAIATARSNRRSCASTSAASVVLTTWRCRCRRKA